MLGCCTQPDCRRRKRCLSPGYLSKVKIFAEGGDVFLKSGPAFYCDAAGGSCLPAYELPAYLNVSGGGQLIYLHTKIACCGPGFLLQKGEVCFFKRQQDRDYRQSQFGVKQRVEFFQFVHNAPPFTFYFSPIPALLLYGYISNLE